MRPVYVVGAGGIGCAVGYGLSLAGAEIIFVDANPEKVSWGRDHGVAVNRLPPRSAEFQHFDDWRPEVDAVIVLCTKCYDNAAVLARLQTPAFLIPIQNGFDGALEARAGRAPEGIASFVSECSPRQTHTRITRRGRLHFGSRATGGTSNSAIPGRDDILARFRQALRSGSTRLGIRFEEVDDILPYKYTKLMYNAAISPLAAAAGLDNGDLLAIPKARRLFFSLLKENYLILREAGIRLGKIGPFHPRTVNRILACAPLSQALAWAFYPTLRGSYCSMSGDLAQLSRPPAGRTEIEFYNRHLVDLARAYPCPLNRKVYELIKRMERERIRPSVEALAALE